MGIGKKVLSLVVAATLVTGIFVSTTAFAESSVSGDDQWYDSDQALANGLHPENSWTDVKFKDSTYTVSSSNESISLSDEIQISTANEEPEQFDPASVVNESWTFSDTAVARYEDGVIIPKRPGTTDFTVRVQGTQAGTGEYQGRYRSAIWTLSCTVVVEPSPNDIIPIQLDPDDHSPYNIQTLLRRTRYRFDVNDDQNIIWSVVNDTVINPTSAPNMENVVTIDNDGIVTANKLGRTLLKGVSGGITCYVRVEVVEPDDEAKRLYIQGQGNNGVQNPDLLLIGQTKSYQAGGYWDDSDPAKESETWTSSDETVATVVNGDVTPLSVGTTTITVSANGYESDSIVVAVQDQGMASVSYRQGTSSYTPAQPDGNPSPYPTNSSTTENPKIGIQNNNMIPDVDAAQDLSLQLPVLPDGNVYQQVGVTFAKSADNGKYTVEYTAEGDSYISTNEEGATIIDIPVSILKNYNEVYISANVNSTHPVWDITIDSGIISDPEHENLPSGTYVSSDRASSLQIGTDGTFKYNGKKVPQYNDKIDYGCEYPEYFRYIFAAYSSGSMKLSRIDGQFAEEPTLSWLQDEDDFTGLNLGYSPDIDSFVDENTDTIYAPDGGGHSPTIINDMFAVPSALPSAGGNSIISVYGVGLPSGLTVATFDANGAATGITGNTTGSDTLQSVSLSFPANGSTAGKSYTVKVSLDGGTTWNTVATVVTVSKHSSGHSSDSSTTATQAPTGTSSTTTTTSTGASTVATVVTRPDVAPVVTGNTSAVSVTVPSDVQSVISSATADKPAEIKIVAPTETIMQQLNNTAVQAVELTIQVPTAVANNADANVNVTINAEPAVLQAAKDEDKDVTLKVMDAQTGREAYSWTFTGDALRNSVAAVTGLDLALNVSPINNDAAASSVVSGNTSNQSTSGILLRFGGNGLLPAPATVRVYVGGQGYAPNSQVYLYYMNSTTNALEQIPGNQYTVDADGYVTVKIAHCSKYVLLLNAATNPYPVKSDTTYPVGVKNGKTYTFTLTVNGKAVPSFTVGNSKVFTGTVKQQDGKYYFTAKAVGTPGAMTALYSTLPGQKPALLCYLVVGK